MPAAGALRTSLDRRPGCVVPSKAAACLGDPDRAPPAPTDDIS
jgi:hypothetical protein